MSEASLEQLQWLATGDMAQVVPAQKVLRASTTRISRLPGRGELPEIPTTASIEGVNFCRAHLANRESALWSCTAFRNLAHQGQGTQLSPPSQDAHRRVKGLRRAVVRLQQQG